MPPIQTRPVCITAVADANRVCITVPTMEGLKQALIAFRREVLMKYPYICAAVLLLWSFYPQFPFQVLYFVFYVVPRSIILGILTCLGFERGGVRSDSIASRYQSQYYGGYTPGNGFFSRSQSYGAIGQDGSDGSTLAEQPHPIRRIFWRFIGWLLLYGSLVVLLKYGGQ
ncbi:hypothetical protein BDN70DRAFT_871245 [Pholiota conissans]|uniref:Uncharacterized protein n=1 Tax=Pholiota conissans TaxID=109636 RepID=A0A9P5ZC96_9AGAR|nr:hypothetical protein BDN70DRAFT_871245 [Pholiota conissans]